MWIALLLSEDWTDMGDVQNDTTWKQQPNIIIATKMSRIKQTLKLCLVSHGKLADTICDAFPVQLNQITLVFNMLFNMVAMNFIKWTN